MNNETKFRSIPLETHLVPPLRNKTRLQDYSPNIFISLLSKSAFKKAIKKKRVKINGKLGFTADFLVGGEFIELFPDKNIQTKPQLNIDIKVLFEDEDLAVVNKPAGIIISGNKKHTLENALPNSLKKSSKKDVLPRPEPIHRLDFPTTGALLIGKTKQAVILLNKMFENREVQKKYIAITIGKQNNSGTINNLIDNKTSNSSYRVISSIDSKKYTSLNLVELLPHTGRRHQLRKHMAAIGNPILGDKKYGIPNLMKYGNGLYLHASSLSFKHPIIHQQIAIEVPLPKKFTKIFKQ